MRAAAQEMIGAPDAGPAPSGSTLHRRLFQRAADYAARFRDELGQRPPRPVISPAQLEARFAGPTPEVGGEALQVLDALHAAAEPGLTGSAGPRFFGWVIGASDPVGVAADMLASAWGQNAGSFATSPAAALAEKVAAGWLLDLLQLPKDCSVGFVTGATMANFVCLAAARSAVLHRVGWDVELDGLNGAPPVRLIVGDDAHTTVFAALRYLGFGERVTRIATDGEGRMDAQQLALALARGGGPTIVIAQAGQIHTGAFDPFADIVRLCRQHGAWLHVDGAFGLWARTVPELAPLTLALDEADSWATDGHKWLQVPYDSGFAIVRDEQAHRRALAITASYLPAATAAEYDPGAYVPELSRRARGFATWAQLRCRGRRGVRALVAQHCALARRLKQRLAAEADIQVLNAVCLNQLIVSFGSGSEPERDALTRRVIARLATDNICLAGGADFHGRYVLRVSIIADPLTESDIDRLAVAIVSAWRHVEAGP